MAGLPYSRAGMCDEPLRTSAWEASVCKEGFDCSFNSVHQTRAGLNNRAVYNTDCGLTVKYFFLWLENNGTIAVTYSFAW